MARTAPSFLRRIGLAFSVLFNAERAAQLQRDDAEGEQPAADASIAPVAPAAEPQPVIVRETTPEAALQLLGLLQREARRQRHDAPHQACVLGAELRHGRNVLLRDHQEVHWRPRVNVVKSKNVIVLVHLSGRDLASNDFAEDAVGVVSTHGGFVQSGMGWLAFMRTMPLTMR